MPADFYKVGAENDRRGDTLGSEAYARDCAAWPGSPLDDAARHFQFTLFRDIGDHLWPWFS